MVDPAIVNAVLEEIHLDAPEDPKINSVIWLILISSFCLVFVGSFATLAAAIFIDSTESGRQIILTVFTSVAGFLAGLFIKSPQSK